MAGGVEDIWPCSSHTSVYVPQGHRLVETRTRQVSCFYFPDLGHILPLLAGSELRGLVVWIGVRGGKGRKQKSELQGGKIKLQLISQKCSPSHPIAHSPRANPNFFFFFKSIECVNVQCCVNYHKLSGLKQCKFILLSGGQKSEMGFPGLKSRCQQGCVPFWRC